MLKNLDVKNVNKSKNRLTLVKLENKKQDKKVLASWERDVPIKRQVKAKTGKKTDEFLKSA